MDKPVLVTGAGGFIGSHLVERLIADGFTVRAFIRYSSSGSRGWLDTLPRETQDATDVVMGDVRDAHSVRAAMRGCDAVLHLAALIGIPYSYAAPQAYVETNVVGTLNILEAARDLGLRRVVHTSTSEVYGTARFVPMDEEHPLHAQSPYAATKIGADQLALSYHLSFGMPVVVVRPFNTFGPRQSERAVIPAIIRQMLAGQRRIALGALHPTRDFTFVADTVQGFRAALDAGPEALGETVNLGTGQETSVGDIVRMVAARLGVDVEVTAEPERTRPPRSEVERLCADAGKAHRLLGWEPRYAGPSGFSRGLDETIAWFGGPGRASRQEPGRYAV